MTHDVRFALHSLSDQVLATHNILSWSVLSRALPRRLTANDFEPLPQASDTVPNAWWQSVSFSEWVIVGLCHAIDLTGTVWYPESQGVQPRAL